MSNNLPKWNIPNMLGGGSSNEELQAAMAIEEPNTSDKAAAEAQKNEKNQKIIAALERSYPALFTAIKNARGIDPSLGGELSAKTLLEHLHKLEKVQRVAEWLTEFAGIMPYCSEFNAWKPLVNALNQQGGKLHAKFTEMLKPLDGITPEQLKGFIEENQGVLEYEYFLKKTVDTKSWRISEGTDGFPGSKAKVDKAWEEIGKVLHKQRQKQKLELELEQKRVVQNPFNPESANSEERAIGAKQDGEVLKATSQAYAENLVVAINARVAEAKARAIGAGKDPSKDTILEWSMLNDGFSVDGLKEFEEICTNNETLSVVRAFYKAKASIINKDDSKPLASADVLAPTSSEGDKALQFTYDEAKEIIISAAQSLSPKIAKKIKYIFQQDPSPIDFSSKKLVYTGFLADPVLPHAITTTPKDGRFAMMDIVKLGHEVTHIAQELFARDAGVSKLYRGMPAEKQFVELPTELMEIALHEEVKKRNENNKNPAVKLAIEGSAINNHIKALKLVAIDHRWLNSLYEKAYDNKLMTDVVVSEWWKCINEFYGDSVVLGDEKLHAFVIPYYPFDTSVESAFVAYRYGLAHLAAMGLGEYRKQKDFAEKIELALEQGGAQPIAETMQALGVLEMNMDFYKAGIQDLKRQVAEFEALAAEALKQKAQSLATEATNPDLQNGAAHNL